MTGPRTWRLWAAQLQTLLGVRRGFFIPHRYARAVVPPRDYPALSGYFTAAQPQFRAVLAAAAAHRDAFRAWRGAAPPAPRFEQDWFPRLDGVAAYTLTRQRKPARIVEIGSGHSTRFFACAIADGGLATRLTAIDPAPRAALAGLAVEWIRSTLQAAGTSPFAGLEPGDFAVIDSSHILTPGSDVDLAFNDILPRLKPGVLVHIHDIFLPDSYPAEWGWRGYNEQNAAAPLLSGGGWRLLWSSHWAATRMAADIAASELNLPPAQAGAFETSLWLEKT